VVTNICIFHWPSNFIIPIPTSQSYSIHLLRRIMEQRASVRSNCFTKVSPWDSIDHLLHQTRKERPRSSKVVLRSQINRVHLGQYKLSFGVEVKSEVFVIILNSGSWIGKFSIMNWSCPLVWRQVCRQEYQRNYVTYEKT
jgi:hypothetical protein